MRVPRRTTGVTLAAALALGLVVVPAARATEQVQTHRVHGADRYATAAGIALEAYPDGVGSVVLASGESFPDALAASFLAGTIGGPILLVTRSTVPEATADALVALEATKVYLVGGAAAIDEAVEAQLERDYVIERIFGADRYDTARAVKQEQDPRLNGRYNGKLTAFVASGESFADALAAGPIAFGRRFPLLLTRRDVLPKVTEDAGLHGMEHVIIVGGEEAVGPEVEAVLRQKALTVERIGGFNRFDTAARLSETALAGMGFKNTGVVVASGIGFADALAGAPYAGKGLLPLLLMGSVPPETEGFVRNHNSTITGIAALGGTRSVSDEDLEALRAVATCRSGSPASSLITLPRSTSTSVPQCSTPTTASSTTTSSTTSSTPGTTVPATTTPTTPLPIDLF